MSFPPYPAYKDSAIVWLGQVPEHWTTTPFWTMYRRVKRTGFGGEQLLSVYRDYGVIPKASRTDNFNKPSEDLDTYQLVQPGDLAINKMKAWQGSVGISGHKGIVSPAYFVYEPMHNAVPRYLHYLFRSPNYIAGYLSLSKGIRPNQWDLEPQYHSRMRVLTPPTAEQSSIADFLNREIAKIDVLVEEQQRLIELLKEKRQAVISHAVTNGLDPSAPVKCSGLVWPDQVPAHWEVLPLTRVVRQFVDYRGVTPQKLDQGAVPLITATQIKDGRINHLLDPVFISQDEYAARMTRGFPEKGDVLLTTEAPLGETAQIEDECVSPGQRIILMKPDPSKVTKKFLFTHFRSHLGQRELWTRASGSTASGIRADRLRATAVFVPPLEEQERIVDYIAEQTSHLPPIEDLAQKQITLLNERRSALISAAVTGSIDVRGLAPAEGEAA
jgi:type I restriction enzyme S subunit